MTVALDTLFRFKSFFARVYAVVFPDVESLKSSKEKRSLNISANRGKSSLAANNLVLGKCFT